MGSYCLGLLIQINQLTFASIHLECSTSCDHGSCIYRRKSRRFERRGWLAAPARTGREEVGEQSLGDRGARLTCPVLSPRGCVTSPAALRLLCFPGSRRAHPSRKPTCESPPTRVKVGVPPPLKSVRRGNPKQPHHCSERESI